MARIIVVEDSKLLRADLVEEVELWGHEVVGFEDGLSGYEAVKASKPDLILSDVHVPGMSGLELMQSVRRLGAGFCDVPFLFLSGIDPGRDPLPGSSTVEFLQKPIDYGALKTAIDRRLARPTEPC